MAVWTVTPKMRRPFDEGKARWLMMPKSNSVHDGLTVDSVVEMKDGSEVHDTNIDPELTGWAALA
jgi:hypothetical protein